jgi:translation elongation factor aEF-1 beta
MFLRIVVKKQKEKTYKPLSLNQIMGTAMVIIKIMPVSPDINLEQIKHSAKQIIEHNKGKNPRFNEEPIVFGFKAVLASFELDESYELEPIENALGKIENVNSSQVVDMRRAFG